MIHDKKHEGVQSHFWKVLVTNELQIKEHVPIGSDREKSIVNAIQVTLIITFFA